MSDLHLMFRRYLKYILYFLALCVLGYGFTEFKDIFLGVILGTGFGLYNLWTMVRKQRQFSRAYDEGKRIRSLGTLSRMASAGIAILIAMKYPEQFNVYSVVFGLMTIYFVIMIDYFIVHLRS
ncbi:ATP synthase subunit I [Metabacillus sp. GX 13764]|uniref:ATP synthase subunit I n=1 Tax=Metabacillus kandeliae TaxID=2900151 RepID=UPI001E3EB4C8|nr:ATP synthase subunit I [Metabacillus kandeliae]MCD7034668.1 ATP synthase subunit I [Metabacillus kandeliae]